MRVNCASVNLRVVRLRVDASHGAAPEPLRESERPLSLTWVRHTMAETMRQSRVFESTSGWAVDRGARPHSRHSASRGETESTCLVGTYVARSTTPTIV